VIQVIKSERLLDNVRERESQIRARCMTGPVTGIQGMGLMLGLVCDRPAADVQKALLERDILAGTSADPRVLRLLPPLVLRPADVERLAVTLQDIGSSPTRTGTAQ
jgi:acetylornithine/succinyldiaminopimelate/putrescine aminotransferase